MSPRRAREQERCVAAAALARRRAHRHALVVIHGMGEQRPLDTLDNLTTAVLARFTAQRRQYFSRPTHIGDSYEARRHIIPPVYDHDDLDARPVMHLFEYHWSHLMTGNRFDDLLTTVRRILLQWPWRVPRGILGLWLVLWAVIVAIAWALSTTIADGGLSAVPSVEEVVGIVLGTGVLGALASYVVTRVLPRTLTGSFVDVVRYLDPSPRSYAVRRAIREGAVDILRELNDEYHRVTIVAHSLGSYVAYDAIRQLWGELGRTYCTEPPSDAPDHGEVPAGLDELEAAATAIGSATGAARHEAVQRYRRAQRELWRGLRDAGHVWRISDLVTLGSPMYMADQLTTRTDEEFRERIARHEFPTCPPQDDALSINAAAEPERARRFTYPHRGRRVLYDAAPFAVTRWTNVWFPTRALLFGDYFGGPLSPLFGPGVLDVPIRQGTWRRLAPGIAHSWYFRAITEEPDGQLGAAFEEALRL